MERSRSFRTQYASDWRDLPSQGQCGQRRTIKAAALLLIIRVRAIWLYNMLVAQWSQLNDQETKTLLGKGISPNRLALRLVVWGS